ncbi:hypothetical protein SLS62_007239 [Diatrype stigma]|uniref:Uncharacterized protein n=1 Tax=Diatrype stigma TaxID=117547 RepID=A0AAN9UM59_9PEZI
MIMVSRVIYGSSYGHRERPVPTFKSYRSQFTPFAPPKSKAERPVVHSDGPPPADELLRYRQINIDSDSAGGSHSVQNTTTVAPGEHRAYKRQTIQSEEYSPDHLPPHEPGETYHDLHKYKPYMHNEPDGSPREEKPKYDDLHKYTPYMYNEDAPAMDSSTKYNDLDKYGPYMYKEDVKAEDSSPEYNDLDQYGPFMYQEDMKTEESPRDPELDRYGPYMYKENMDKEDNTPKYDDLHKYNPTEFDDFMSTTREQPFSQYGDLEQYKKFRHHDAEEGLGKEMSTDSKPSISERLRKLDLTGVEPQDKVDKPLKTGVSNTKTTSRVGLESAMDIHHEASNATDREAFANVQESRVRKGDGATQASKSTTAVNSFWDHLARRGSYMGNSASETEAPKDQSSYATMPKGHVTAEGGEPSASRLETALDRQNNSTTGNRIDRRAREDAGVDPYSTEPQGLETAYAEECGGKPTWPTFVHTYVTNQEVDSQTPEQRSAETTIVPASMQTSSTSSEEPAVYKILAYDPTMNDINTAETTSTVPPHDKEAPLLTPADVLPRLSNPSQFLPYFVPLQADGFEIASGAGDVLVFRKVNRSLNPTAMATTIRNKKTYRNHQQPPVNPIDMMGRPAPLPSAAAFASPTGFLNYDLPTASAAPAPAPAVADATEVVETSVRKGEARTTRTTPLVAPTAAAAAASSGTNTTSANIESDSNGVRSAPNDNPTNESKANKPPARDEDVFEDEELRESCVMSFIKLGAALLAGAYGGMTLERFNARHEQLKQRKGGVKRKKLMVAKVGTIVLILTSCVAVFSYVLGVLADYFITGGMDGRGPVGL